MTMAVSMDIYEILKYMPHRYPFLLLDRVESLEKGKSIVGLKNVTINEAYFSGHFPENPVMPGVMILEALAQAAGILAVITQGHDPGDVLYFYAGADQVRFKQVVIPGDQLKLHVEVEKSRQEVWKFKGRALVKDKIVCVADILLAGRMKE
jgi:3-hydroxyacyl-[acyl-carrier-protein] dehydratase